MDRTEKEKMTAGLLYDAADPELDMLRARARKLTRKYNSLTEEAGLSERMAILEELFGSIGEDTLLECPLRIDYGCFTTFGKRCEANFGLTVLDSCPVTIGDDVLIGPNCTLATPVHPFWPAERNVREDGGRQYKLEYAKPIVIGDSCWLASCVTVCGGVTIGECSVIGAGSVVTRDIPPYSLAAGNPCRVIRRITEDDRMG